MPLLWCCCWWKTSGEPVEVGSLSHYLQGFKDPRWCRIASINSFILTFKLSSYFCWVCSNSGAFAWQSSNKQRRPSHHERQMFQVFMGPKEKFSWNWSRVLEGVVGRKLPSKIRLWVELMGATLEKRTNNFWMPNYQYKSSLFSFRKSHVTVVLGYLQITKNIKKSPPQLPSTNQPQQLGGGAKSFHQRTLTWKWSACCWFLGVNSITVWCWKELQWMSTAPPILCRSPWWCNQYSKCPEGWRLFRDQFLWIKWWSVCLEMVNANFSVIKEGSSFGGI